MKKTSILVSAIFTGLLALSGCIDSPLLNHADASSLDAIVEAQAAKCPFQFIKSDLCASMEWVKNPTDDESGSFLLRFWSLSKGTESGPYISPTHDAFVKLWMPSMGHGSSPVTVKPLLDAAGVTVPGVYDVSDVFFVMHGDWEIFVQLKQARKVIEQAKVDVRI